MNDQKLCGWKTKRKRNLACICCMVVTHLIGRAKQAPHWCVQSRFCVIYVCRYRYMSVVCQINCVGGNTWTKQAHAQSQFLGG